MSSRATCGSHAACLRSLLKKDKTEFDEKHCVASRQVKNSIRELGLPVRPGICTSLTVTKQ